MDAARVPAARRRPVPDDQFGGRLAGCVYLELDVVGTVDLAPWLRSIRFASPDLVGFEHRPGQDVMLDVPGHDAPVRRRYTIRRTDPAAGTLDIEAVLHGDGPFARWAARTGDRIEGIGPRGNGLPSDLPPAIAFIGDESAIPVTFAMIEAVPPGHRVTALIAADRGDQPLGAPASAADVSLTWTTADALVDAVTAAPLEREAAAFVYGERHLVRAAVDALTARGLPADAVTSKAYWRRDQANAAHGEPARD